MKRCWRRCCLLGAGVVACFTAGVPSCFLGSGVGGGRVVVGVGVAG